MYEHREIVLRKLERHHLWKLKTLKEESWMTTHQASMVNHDNQCRWYDSLVAENVNMPRNVVLQAEKVQKSPQDHHGWTFGIFKINNIDYVNRTADCGWDVFSEFRGQKLGKQLVVAGVAFCFDILSLRRLNAEILDGNIASMKCAEAAGFVVEGVKRQAVHKLGNYVDSTVMGMLLSEWKGQGVGKPSCA